jgi:hypothetical protein
MSDDLDPNLDDTLEPEDVNSDPIAAGGSDPNDEIPVPIAMSPAEIDERAQVVEALRGKAPPPPPVDGEPRLEA